MKSLNQKFSKNFLKWGKWADVSPGKVKCELFLFLPFQIHFLSVILSKPSAKDGNARFTSVPMKPLWPKMLKSHFSWLKCFTLKMPACFPAIKMRKSLETKHNWYLVNFLSDKALISTVVNRALSFYMEGHFKSLVQSLKNVWYEN